MILLLAAGAVALAYWSHVTRATQAANSAPQAKTEALSDSGASRPVSGGGIAYGGDVSHLSTTGRVPLPPLLMAPRPKPIIVPSLPYTPNPVAVQAPNNAMLTPMLPQGRYLFARLT